MNGFISIIRRFPTATGLNLLGLVVALTACYVFKTQVEFANNYNKNIDGYENVFRMEADALANGRISAHMNRPLAEGIKQMPQVESIFCGQFNFCNNIFKIGEKVFSLPLSKCTSDGLKALHPKMIAGVDTFGTQSEIIIPASFAVKMFGTIDCLGKDVQVREDATTTVIGIFEDFPDNCMATNSVYFSMCDENISSPGNWNYNCLVRTTSKMSADELKSTFETFLISQSTSEDDDEETVKQLEEYVDKMNLNFRPLSETYFSGVDGRDKGNRGMMFVLDIASVVLLIVAGINFANFTLAETPIRIKGINTRKVLGMTNGALRMGMIAETILTAAIAFAISVGSLYLLSIAPWLNEIIVGTLSLSEHLDLVAYIGIAAVLIGLVVGLYPAFYATSFPPALVLKGSFGLSPKGRMMRKILVGIQLFVAFVMAIYIGVLFSQRNYIFNSDYGFDKDEILYSDNLVGSASFETVRSELEKIPGVESVGFTGSIPGTSDIIMTWGRGEGEQQLTTVATPCDWNFLQTMGIEIVDGRNFNEHDVDVCVMNENARDTYDWIEIDKPFAPGCQTVVGICKNHRIYSARKNNSNAVACYLIFGEQYEDWKFSYKVVVRVGANTDKIAVKKQLEETLPKTGPKADIKTEFMFMDENLQQTFKDEFRFISQVELFSAICLLITLVGVLCLTMFETEYRRKEIGIRKVLGSQTRDIIAMFCKEYTLLIITAFVFAAPLAWMMADTWLQNFAERTPIHWWLFPVAMLIVTLIVLLTVVTQTWRTANENPVENIKTE